MKASNAMRGLLSGLLLAGCGGNDPPATVTPAAESSSSPFGMHPANTADTGYASAKDLGVRWNRGGIYFVWDFCDPTRNGNFSFKNATPGGPPMNYDALRLSLHEDEGISNMVNVTPFMRGGDFGSSQEKDVYAEWVRALVERYDGDEDLGCALEAPDCYKPGDGEYPDEKLISVMKANPIRHWQVGNQVRDIGSGMSDYASKFAEVQRITYDAVKAADPSGRVLIAGDSAKEDYPAVFKELGGKSVDILDLHRFGTYDQYDPTKDFDYIKSSLSENGFDTNTLEFWITETGTYSGDPIFLFPGVPDFLPLQTEKEQAVGLLKTYAAALCDGIDKVFWAWSIREGFMRDGSIHDYSGLVYDGCEYTGTSQSDPSGVYSCNPADLVHDRGLGVKKLAYYSYKQMTSKLDGANWDNTKVVEKGSGHFVCRFERENKPIWLAWSTGSGSTDIEISQVSASQVQVTEGVPTADSGLDVMDFASAFHTESKASSNGAVTVTVGEVPVFIEEAQ